MAERKSRRKMESTLSVTLPVTFHFAKETSYKDIMYFLRTVKKNASIFSSVFHADRDIDSLAATVEVGKPILQKQTTYES